jgi:hypothetical protein
MFDLKFGFLPAALTPSEKGLGQSRCLNSQQSHYQESNLGHPGHSTTGTHLLRDILKLGHRRLF